MLLPSISQQPVMFATVISLLFLGGGESKKRSLEPMVLELFLDIQLVL